MPVSFEVSGHWSQETSPSYMLPGPAQILWPWLKGWLPDEVSQVSGLRPASGGLQQRGTLSHFSGLRSNFII